MKSLGKQIQEARQKKNMSLADTARAMKMSEAELASWEKDAVTPDRHQMEALGDYLGTVFFDPKALEAQRQADEATEREKLAEFRGKAGGQKAAGAAEGGSKLWLIPLAAVAALAVLTFVLISPIRDELNETKQSLSVAEHALQETKSQLSAAVASVEQKAQDTESRLSEVTASAEQNARETAEKLSEVAASAEQNVRETAEKLSSADSEIQALKAADASAKQAAAKMDTKLSALEGMNAARGVSFSASGTQVTVYPLEGSVLTITPSKKVEDKITVTHTGYNMAAIKRSKWSSDANKNLTVSFASDRQFTLDGTADATAVIYLTPTSKPKLSSPVLFTLYAGTTYYISACRLAYFDENGTMQYITEGMNTASAKNAVAYTPEKDIQVRGIHFRVPKGTTYSKKITWQPYVGVVRPNEWVPYQGKTYTWDKSKGAFTVYALDGLNMVFTDADIKVSVKGKRAALVEADRETAAVSDQALSLGRYAFSSSYRKKSGYYTQLTGWVTDKAYNTYVFSVESGAKYFYSPYALTLLGLDENKAVVETLTRTRLKDTKYYVYEAINSDRVRYVAYPVEIANKAVTPTLWHANFLFDNEFTLPEGGTAISLTFQGDRITSQNAARGLGSFAPGYYSIKGQFNESETFLHSGFRVLDAGTVIDTSNTAVQLLIRGTNAAGRVNKTAKRYTVSKDLYASVAYRLLDDGWKWPEAATEVSLENAAYFIRLITPEEKASNPWQGKTWYSYGTSISDIALKDEEGNNGHSGKWPLYLDAVSGLKRINCAIGGGGIMPAQAHGGNVKEAILQTPADADLVTLELLSNDDLDNLGEIGDQGDDTFLGNLAQCLDYLTTRTRARVVFIALSETAADAPLSAGRIQYRAAVEKVKQLCALYGVPVIDADANAMTQAQVDFSGAQVNPVFTYLGGEMYGQYIWQQLRQIKPNSAFAIARDEGEAQEMTDQPQEGGIPEPDADQPETTETPDAPIDQPETPETPDVPVDQPETPETSDAPIDQPETPETPDVPVDQPETPETPDASIDQTETDELPEAPIDQPESAGTAEAEADQPEADAAAPDAEAEQPDSAA